MYPVVILVSSEGELGLDCHDSRFVASQFPDGRSKFERELEEFGKAVVGEDACAFLGQACKDHGILGREYISLIVS